MLRALGAFCLLFGPAFAQDGVKFEPVAIESHIYDGGWEHFVGGGVAVFDCDGDDLPDLFAAGGENPAALFRNASKVGGPVVFREDTPVDLSLTGVIGAYPIDIDNDALEDLVILRVGPNQIFKGESDCQFTPFVGLGVDLGTQWTTAFSATWEAGQTKPTLAFGNYVDRTDEAGPFGACDENVLFRPEGETYGKPISLSPAYCPLSMLFSDWSRTGIADLRVSNDRHYYVKGGAEQLWRMSEPPRLFTQEDGWNKHELWGMGIASRDITGDGVPEVMMTSMGDQRMQQRRLDQTGPVYEDMPFNLGTTAHRPYFGGDGRPSTGWHVAFGDVQNDGRDDIFIAKGNVEQMPGLAMRDPNNLLIQDQNGTFKEAGEVAGLASLHRGRGAALTDLNGDGLLDVIVVNRRADMEVYQNMTASGGNWIGLRVHQSGSNRHGIGAWIEVDTGHKIMAREITIGGGHAGGVLGFEHFGLGVAKSVRMRMVWSDQSVSDWIKLDAGRNYYLDRFGANVRPRG